MQPREIAVGFVAPGVIAGLTLLAGRFGRRTPEAEPAWWTRVLPPAAVALGFVPAYMALNGYRFELWDKNGAMRYGAIISVVLAAGLLTAILRGSSAMVATLRVAMFAGLGWITAGALTPGFFSWDQLTAIMLGVGVIGAGVAHVLDRVAADVHGWRFPLVLLPVVGLAAPTLFFNGYASGALLAGGLVAIVAASAVAGVLVPKQRFDGGGVTTVLGLVIAMLLVHQGFDAGAPQTPAIVLLLGLAMPAIILWGPLAKRRPIVRTAAATVAAIAAGGLALFAALQFNPESEADAGSGYDPYGEYDPGN